MPKYLVIKSRIEKHIVYSTYEIEATSRMEALNKVDCEEDGLILLEEKISFAIDESQLSQQQKLSLERQRTMPKYQVTEFVYEPDKDLIT
jgi:hypothetical protein